MKISRRGFISSALKGLVVAAIAPAVALKGVTASPVPRDKVGIGKVPSVEIKKYKGFACNDYTQQITIMDYEPGMEISYDAPGEPACCRCMYFDRCTGTGKAYAPMTEDFIPEMWSKKLQASFYESAIRVAS